LLPAAWLLDVRGAVVVAFGLSLKLLFNKKAATDLATWTRRVGHKFWARGYFVTTFGRDEEVIQADIRNQELADQQLDQLELKISAAPKSNQSP